MTFGLGGVLFGWWVEADPHFGWVVRGLGGWFVVWVGDHGS